MGQRINREDLLTVGDLQDFKIELLAAIKLIITKESLPAKRWIKSAEARKVLGISAGKLQMLRDSGKLPFSKVGGSIFYDQQDLIALYEKGKKTI